MRSCTVILALIAILHSRAGFGGQVSGSVRFDGTSTSLSDQRHDSANDAAVLLEREQIRIDFDFAVAKARRALVRGDFAAFGDRCDKARAEVAQNPRVFSAAELRDFNERLASLGVQAEARRQSIVATAESAWRRSVADRGRREADSRDPSQTPRNIRERTVADLIAAARGLIDDANYPEAILLVEQILTIDPRNDYAIGVRPLLEDRAGPVDRREIQEDLDWETQTAFIAAERRKLAAGKDLHLDAGAAGRGGPATQP